MEFGKHIGKGIWAFADKSLPAIYGLGLIFLVIRVLPEKEFGAFGIVQGVFALATSLAFAFALQPMTKFVSEKDSPGPYVIASLFLYTVFLLLVSAIVLVFNHPISNILDSKKQVDLTQLFLFIPLLFLTSLFRNYGVCLLQAKYRVQNIFWIDAVYFLGSLILFYCYNHFGLFHSAQDVILITLVTTGCSSVLALILTRDLLADATIPQWETITQYWHFGKYTFGGSATSMFFSQMDIFFVSSFAGVVAVATYNAAKIFNRFFDILSQIIQMFLIPFSSKAYAQNDTKNLTVVAEKAICFSIILFLPLFFVMLVFPGLLLHLLYGTKYEGGASIVRVFSFMALIVPWNAVISSYLIGAGKVKEALYMGIVYVVLSLPVFVVMTSQFGSIGASVGYSFTYAILTIYLMRFVKRIIPLRFINVVLRTKDGIEFVRNRINRFV